MRTRMRMTAAAAAVALLTATAGAAAASTPGASPKPSSPTQVKPSPTGSGKSGGSVAWLDKIAASLHVSPARLNAALRDAKQTMGRLGVGPLDPAVVSVVSHDLGVSAAKARVALQEVFGAAGAPGKTAPPPGTPDPKLSQTLAAILHVTEARAADVLSKLDRLSQQDRGIAPDSPGFRAIAAGLHITPQQLVQAIDQLKRQITASDPTPSSSPAS